jgi:hypothetical protein
MSRHPPETRPLGKRTGGYVLDAHATLARDCWVYPIVSVFPSEEDTQIPYELEIDPSGMVLEPVGAPKLHLPIKQRSSAFSFNPDHPHAAKFSEKIDAEGRPLIVRLFFSPFRLGPVAIEQLVTPKYRQGRSRHLPYLWEWQLRRRTCR